MTTARYLLSEAMDNIRANRTTTVMAVVTTAFTMLGMGVFLLPYMNVQDVLGSLLLVLCSLYLVLGTLCLIFVTNHKITKNKLQRTKIQAPSDYET